jgi:formate dehydrogenase maturation protein FdhE
MARKAKPKPKPKPREANPLRELAKQEFMAGATLRQLAKKHKRHLRTLANWSKEGNWDNERYIQRTATALPVLAETINKAWRERVESIVGTLTDVSMHAAILLAGKRLDNLDYRELATLIKLLADSTGRLAELLPKPPAGGESVVNVLLNLARGQERMIDVTNEKDTNE